MSLNKMVKVDCPKCKERQEFKVWQSVNVTEDPSLKDEVFSGEIFTFTCSKCGTKAFIAYPMIYHDAGRKFFVYFNPDGDFKNAIENEGYVTEKTSDYLEMLEIIRAFEDDMGKEKIKELKDKLLGKLKESKIEQLKNIDKIYYVGKNDTKASFYVPEIKSKIDIDLV